MRRWSRAVIAQLLGWMLCRMLLATPEPGLVAAVLPSLLAGLMAALFSLVLREPRWRAPMQFAFALAAGLGSQSGLPASVWAIALGASLLIFGGGLTGRRAPLYLTQPRAQAALQACLPEALQGRCLDVGAGVGSFILRMAPLRPGLQFCGIERSPLVCLIGDLRCRLAGAGRVQFGDLWRCQLENFQVVYAFLSPEAMEGLWQKARLEMAPGSLLVVNAFPIPDVEPESSERYGDGDSDCIYCYRLPAPAPGLGRGVAKPSSSAR